MDKVGIIVIVYNAYLTFCVFGREIVRVNNDKKC